jgi:hypothetical protein
VIDQHGALQTQYIVEPTYKTLHIDGFVFFFFFIIIIIIIIIIVVIVIVIVWNSIAF